MVKERDNIKGYQSSLVQSSGEKLTCRLDLRVNPRRAVETVREGAAGLEGKGSKPYHPARYSVNVYHHLKSAVGLCPHQHSMHIGFRALILIVSALAAVGCRTVGTSPTVRPAAQAEPVELGSYHVPVRVGLDEIGRLSAGHNALVELRDGRRRDVVGLSTGRDSVSYVVMPGDWLEQAPRQHIASISLRRTNRWKGAFHGGRLGFLLAAIVGPAAEYWAGARGGTLMWAVPVYGVLGIALGAPVGAAAGVPELYRYSGGPVRPNAFLAGEPERRSSGDTSFR